ncbi:hypothetical protein BSK52_16380 [Paenibacillus odorifer]|uniref:Uncharacterized protein n=1 Tax=Paenibacillus odorifer TaxID=189426 RepID=A0A1R0XVP8_9BACL|nr:hypothetical protein BSK52_16380 [Paenibacillus odorifer]
MKNIGNLESLDLWPARTKRKYVDKTGRASGEVEERSAKKCSKIWMQDMRQNGMKRLRDQK